MKNLHRFINKIIIASLLCVFIVGSGYSIEEKDYKSMTDRDRILLSVSYYEVSMKYEALNNKALAESYRKEAIKIEKDVVKYYKGELEIPKKTIDIDWNSIFADETSDEEPQDSADVETEDDEIYDVSDDIDDEYLDNLLNGGYQDETTDDTDEDWVDLLDDDMLDDDSENAVDADSDTDSANDSESVGNDDSDIDTANDGESVENADSDIDAKDSENVGNADNDSSEANAVENDTAAADNEANTSESDSQQSAESDSSSDISDESDDADHVSDVSDDAQAVHSQNEIPPQTEPDTISADIDEDESDDWIPGQTDDADVVIRLSQIVRNFIDGVNAGDPDKAVSDFADYVVMQSSAFNMQRDELRDTIAVWITEHDDKIPDYTDIVIADDEDGGYEIGVMFDTDFNFFVPMNNKKLVFRVKMADGRYVISEIKYERQKAQVSAPESENGYLHRFVSAVISGDYEIVASYIAPDVWIASFNMLFPASEILDHLQNWAIDNPNVSSVSEVIDIESITNDDDAALEMIKSVELSGDDYDIIKFRLLNKTFLPGDPSKDTFCIIVSKSGVSEGRISAICQ